MRIDNILKITSITPCGLQNGNYRNDFKNKSSNTYQNSKLTTFKEILEKEKFKHLG